MGAGWGGGGISETVGEGKTEVCTDELRQLVTGVEDETSVSEEIVICSGEIGDSCGQVCLGGAELLTDIGGRLVTGSVRLGLLVIRGTGV